MEPFKTGYKRCLESSSSDESDEVPPPLIDGLFTETGGKVPETPKKKLFTGLQFFVTASDNQVPLDPLGSDSKVVAPYNKNELKATLKEHGGTVVSSVSKESGEDDIYLISDNYARTLKYLYCVAACIPCVSDNWIKKSIEENQLLDWKLFQLKSGYSLENQTVIEPHTNKPLLGEKILIDDEVFKYWEPVLTAAEAISVTCNFTKNIYKVPTDVCVVVANFISQFNKDQVNEVPLPIVKPEWIIQSIITGEMADFFGHEDYRIPAEEEFGEDNDENNPLNI